MTNKNILKRGLEMPTLWKKIL